MEFWRRTGNGFGSHPGVARLVGKNLASDPRRPPIVGKCRSQEQMRCPENHAK